LSAVDVIQCYAARRKSTFKQASHKPEAAMIAPTFLALAFGSQLFITVAEGVPAFDTTPGCRRAVTVMPGSFEACMSDEQGARATLAAQWESFAASDRATCAQNETVGGAPSYVELLTCLQMAKAARTLPADNAAK
jgi:hypothetical protein